MHSFAMYIVYVDTDLKVLIFYRTLPRAILIGLPIVILVYLLINISFFVVFSIHEMENVASEAIAIVSIDDVVVHNYVQCTVKECICTHPCM